MKKIKRREMSIKLLSTKTSINVSWTNYLLLLHSNSFAQSIRNGYFNKRVWPYSQKRAGRHQGKIAQREKMKFLRRSEKLNAFSRYVILEWKWAINDNSLYDYP